VNVVLRPALMAAMPRLGLAGASGVVASMMTRGWTDVRLAVPHLPVEFWVLAGLAVVADVRPFPVPANGRRMTTVFLSICFTFAIMLLWGPAVAIAVQAVSVAGAGFRQHLGVRPTVFIAVRMAVALIAADAVLKLFGSPTFGLGLRLSQADVFAVFMAGLAWFAVNYVLLIVEVRHRYGTGWRPTVSRTFGHELLSAGALLLLAPLLLSAPTGWIIMLILVPVIAVSQVARLAERQEEQLRIDPLTGLLSRRAFAAEVTELTSRSAPRDTSDAGRFALLLIDLDRFKNVNDALGHAVGDRVLAHVAGRLVETVGANDRVARLGGDEFAVVCGGVTDAEPAAALAGRITSQLRRPAYVDGLPLDVSASVGIAMYPAHGEDFATLMRHADVAMYAAKHHNAAVSVYNAQSDHNSAERLGLLADLRHALEDPSARDEVTLMYQPQVTIGAAKVVGAEALLRWNHPEYGLISPDEVVRAAEHSAVMSLLTVHVIDQVVGQLAAWRAAGLRLRASLNVSVRDLQTETVADYLAQRLSRAGIPPDQIQIEITETALMADPHSVLNTVRRLSELGVGIALDDFGTGYSSLLHLRRLPLTEVKIDQSFVRSMATNSDDEAIVRSTIGMAHALGLRVVAEGVENAAVAAMLADAGCDLAQGWHYGRPMPPDRLVGWLYGEGLTLT
jgi:diguanylate cyclase (GGDEF)-like protein